MNEEHVEAVVSMAVEEFELGDTDEGKEIVMSAIEKYFEMQNYYNGFK